jgi:hypothetical protein
MLVLKLSVMLSVVILSVVTPSVVILSVVILSVVIPSVVILSVIILRVILLNVVAPLNAFSRLIQQIFKQFPTDIYEINFEKKKFSFSAANVIDILRLG